MKKIFLGLAILAVLGLICQPCAASPSTISITGLVKHPLNLTMDDLAGFDTIKVQLNEVMEDGSYRGVFYYRGVPLKTLLETAFVQKDETAFSKPVDLAILARDSKGREVALSWGEVFYRNSGRTIVATSALPVMPHKDCRACHTPEEYKGRLDQLNREIGFPKLVVAGDAYADRSLENLTAVEVLEVRPATSAKKMEWLFSPHFSITGAVGEALTVKNIQSYVRTALRVKHLGEGKGYHGIDKFGGVPFKAILKGANLKRDLSTVLLISAPDGYRSLFSYGELFLAPEGDRVMVANRIDDQTIKKGGKFRIVCPDDLMSDRTVKAVQKVEIIPLRKGSTR